MDPDEAGAVLRDAVLSKEAVKAGGLPDTPVHRMIRTLMEKRRAWVDVARLLNIERLVPKLPNGALVECGVAKGASLSIMAAVAGDRDVWGFDSFEGLPDLTESDNASGEGLVGLRCSGPEGEAAVAETFRLVGAPMDGVRIVKGWFDQTLVEHRSAIGAIAMLRVDGDWYEATRCCLDILYDSVTPGGVVIIDDYGAFEGARRATNDFRAERGIGSDLRFTPDTVVDEAYWFA